MEMTQKRICSSDPLVYLYFVKVLKLLRRLKQLSASVAELKTNNLCCSLQKLASIITVFIYASRNLFVCLDDLDFCPRVARGCVIGQMENSLQRLQMLLNKIKKTPLSLLSVIHRLCVFYLQSAALQKKLHHLEVQLNNEKQVRDEIEHKYRYRSLSSVFCSCLTLL